MDTDCCSWDSVFHDQSEGLFTPSPKDNTLERPKDEGHTASQVPTPPQSPLTQPPDENTLVSVSTSFHPTAQHHSLPPDLALLSSDSVFFYVHSPVLLAASRNSFASTLPFAPEDATALRMHHVPDPSPVLNVILHTIYGLSCAHYAPPFEVLITALHALPKYGITPKAHIAPHHPLFALLLSHAELFPLELYALAAKFDLYDLAAATSSHLLTLQLPTLTDEMAEQIGPVYLKRLFFLHMARMDALKAAVSLPPQLHPPTPSCDFANQKGLTRAWALASAYFVWDARPDTSVTTLESALTPLGKHLSCDQCKYALQERITSLTTHWATVKQTI